MNAVRMSAGARATNAPSHGRRRTTSAVQTTVTTRQAKSITAFTAKKNIVRAPPSAMPVIHDATCMKKPVRTGYSNAGPRPSPVWR
jgi:hypothetical protein